MNLKSKRYRRFGFLVLILSLTMGFGIFFFRWRKQKLIEERISNLREAQAPHGVTGLTNDVAHSRQPEFDLKAEQRKEDRQFLSKAIRQSLSATYNIDLFGIALILFLLDNVLGAIGTMLIVLLNLVLNTFQQFYTKLQLNEIVKDLRPQVNVIRGGRLRSIDLTEVVEEDVLIVIEGDEFPVDGVLLGESQVVIEQPQLSTGDSETKVITPGEQIMAGSYCLQGRGIYRAQQNGLLQYQSTSRKQLDLLFDELTPLQKFMGMVFRTLFVLVLVFGSLLFVDALFTNANLVSSAYHDAFSTIFAIAPTSLLFILIITYAVGVLRISDRGALVYDASSIEVLANSDFLCISRDSLLSGLEVNFELVATSTPSEELSENLVRRMVGDFMHTMPNLNKTDEMLVQSFPGQPRAAIEIVPLLFERGWDGATFDEPDLRGTFILGLPEIIDSYLIFDWGEIAEEIDQSLSRFQNRFTSWMKERFNRNWDEPSPEKTEERGSNLKIKNREKQTPLVERLFNRLDQLLSPMEDQAYFEREFQEGDPWLQLTFAYSPDPVPIIDQRNQPRIPDNLIPLANLEITEVFLPDAENSIQSLTYTGLGVKILSSLPPQEIISTAVLLDLPREEIRIGSGNELTQLSEQQFSEEIIKTDLIGDLTPSQKAAVIESLRSKSDGVVMMGNDVSDVPALNQANFRIAQKSGTQAALKIADVVLLKESLSVLPHVLITGQRMVNGILDVFKLYLSQTIAQLILILFMLFLGMEKFPMHPTQAGFVSAIAIAFPNIFLSVWAAEGRISGQVIRQRLAQFIIPAAVTTAILAWGVQAFFMTQTQDPKYAEVTVTFAMLFAAWLRVLFVQPPSDFWTGAAPLRGDRRVIGVVIGSILLFAVIISIPLFAELLRTHWLRTPLDYVWIALAVAVWAFSTRAIWRSNWWKSLVDKI